MKFIHGLYARIIVSLGALAMGAFNMMHPPHGIEHFFCLAGGLLLAFFGIFGFSHKDKVVQTGNVVHGDMAGGDLVRSKKDEHKHHGH